MTTPERVRGNAAHRSRNVSIARRKCRKALEWLEAAVTKFVQYRLNVHLVRPAPLRRLATARNARSEIQKKFGVFAAGHRQSLMLDECAIAPTVDERFHIAVATRHLCGPARDVLGELRHREVMNAGMRKRFDRTRTRP